VQFVFVYFLVIVLFEAKIGLDKKKQKKIAKNQNNAHS